jgi:protein-S-isoprenylcysteine O-methyltransferase Ste14
MILLYVSSVISLGLTLWAIMAVRSDYAKHQILTNFTTVVVWVAYLFHAGVVIWAASLNTWIVRFPKWLTIPAGTILVLFGMAIITIAILNFRTFQRMSGLQTDRLITDGIYAWSRNPQNLGWGLVLVGVALLGRSGFALLLSVLFGLAVHIYIVLLEEPYLEHVYGYTYRNYCAKTARYLGIPRKNLFG